MASTVRSGIEKTVFISYQRNTGTAWALAIAQNLTHHGYDVFFDYEDTGRPEDFEHVIREQIRTRAHFLILLTPSALESIDLSGNRLRREIETAIEHRRNIVPLMLEGFDFATPVIARHLTGTLAPLKRFNGITILADYFGESMTRLRTKHLNIALAAAPEPSTIAVEAARRQQAAAATAAPINQRDLKAERWSIYSPLNEGKLILVGRGAVGKTSLVKGLLDRTFDGDEEKTQGINIRTWSFDRSEDSFRVNVWDFGGQEMMHATHQFFLTERSLYLLVLNGREGGEDVDAAYWLKHIETFGGESPVIVVQNKITQHPFELDYRGLRARYPQIRGFIKTDCKSMVGIEALREAIQMAISEMPEVRISFPPPWIAVKQRLESIEAEYVSQETFVRLCSDAGIVGDSERDSLSWSLHCLGIALNYRDDSRLRETNVLKPQWVTYGIYKILNAKTLAEKKGELHLKDLSELLPRERYPIHMHSFLLELMRKFSLCFPFSDEMDRYLIPELLGKEEPEEAQRFPPRECLNFEYQYGILPEGLLPRFIVRTHTMSRGKGRWRSGVLLAYDGCEAIVSADTIERRVVVRVSGRDAAARRRLLAIIRYDLERINSEFKDRLDAQAKVPLTDHPTVSIDYSKLIEFERMGIAQFPELIGQKVVSIDVNKLLNGVAFKEEREALALSPSGHIQVFFSYSHKDEVLRDELETHLKLLQRQRVISTWHDRKIPSGVDWDQQINDAIEVASIILLLVSADFIASDLLDCWDVEVRRALERHESGDATVIPVLLRHCDWKDAPFAKLNGLPTGMKPVTAWPDRDAAWTNVTSGIRSTVEETRRANRPTHFD